MTSIKCSRMFRGNLRTNTCRIILLTSLVWIFILIILMRYADYLGTNFTDGKRRGEYSVEVNFVYSYFYLRMK